MVSDKALEKLQEQIMAWPMTQRFVVQQLIEDYRMDREDLRAYKATGLTPEEVERSKLEIEAGCVKAIARTYGIDINRLRKLAEADKDGRVVVLPCKVGDTVYFRTYDCYGTVDLGIQPHKVTSIVGHAIVRGRYTDVELSLGQYGVSWFLTREEAEEELRRGDNA